MNKHLVAAIAVVALLGLHALLAKPALAEEAGERFQLSATYGVQLSAFDLGDFHLTAKLKDRSYELKGRGRFSLLTGMLYSASGKTESRGRLLKDGAEPSRFTVTYKGGDKREERRLSFDDGAVDQVSITPKKKIKPGNVPVTSEQLRQVLDPLTAAFLSVRSNGAGPDEVCRQTVPVFDGKQRFDLVLSPKRSEQAEDAPKGLTGPFAVCRVKFVPIGGHRPDHPGTKFMSEADGIEVWLASLPRTGLHIPYRIVVPTAWGSGLVTLSEISLDG
jgi:hypothetical protein